jgi:hypothetical protein
MCLCPPYYYNTTIYVSHISYYVCVCVPHTTTNMSACLTYTFPAACRVSSSVQQVNHPHTGIKMGHIYRRGALSCCTLQDTCIVVCSSTSTRSLPRVCSSAQPSMRQHVSACVSIRQHTSAYVSIRQHTSAYVSIRQHTSAYRQHASARTECAAAQHSCCCTHTAALLLYCCPY